MELAHRHTSLATTRRRQSLVARRGGKEASNKAVYGSTKVTMTREAVCCLVHKNIAVRRTRAKTKRAPDRAYFSTPIAARARRFERFWRQSTCEAQIRVLYAPADDLRTRCTLPRSATRRLFSSVPRDISVSLYGGRLRSTPSTVSALVRTASSSRPTTRTSAGYKSISGQALPRTAASTTTASRPRSSSAGLSLGSQASSRAADAAPPSWTVAALAEDVELATSWPSLKAPPAKVSKRAQRRRARLPRRRPAAAPRPAAARPRVGRHEHEWRHRRKYRRGEKSRRRRRKAPGTKIRDVHSTGRPCTARTSSGTGRRTNPAPAARP